MRLWYYLLHGSAFAYGPVRAETEKKARAEIRRVWNMKNTRWVQVWETTQSSIDMISRQNEATARELQAAGHAICSTDL
jgi:hypothetical protein